MRQLPLLFAATIAIAAMPVFAQESGSDGPYHVIKTAKVGGDGGFDYVYADSAGRKLYIPRLGRPSGHVTVYDLDTLAPLGDIPDTNAHGVAADAKSHHAFASSKPVAMWDTQTLKLIKTIDVDGGPDGILDDSYNQRVYVFSHGAPNATVIDAKTGAVLGTIDLGGAPEQAQSDGHGKIYVDLEDQGAVAVVDAKTMKVAATYSLNGKASGLSGLGLDAKNHVLFVACRKPASMVMLDANTGKYLADLPIGDGCDGAGFNPATMEAFASVGQSGALSIIKEKSPTSFAVEQTLKTMPGARTMTIDFKTNHVFTMAGEYQAPQPGETGRGRRAMVPGSFTIVEVGKG
ncbi:MAG TPA: hypothetical protein VMI31_15120 [Fimbriimonadaceae bacterium]|nr:hypothetical protein [Fimbriimonadaceae bacterium]